MNLPPLIDRDPWNESFHKIHRHPNEKYLLKGSNVAENYSIAERLQRFENL